MINYIIQIILFQVLFLAVYDLFLQKETFFKWNRFYLLITPILSFIIPFLKFESIQKSVPQELQEFVVLLPEVILNPQSIIENTESSVQTFNYMNIGFYVGMILFSIVFLFKLFKISKVIYANKVIQKLHYKLVLLTEKQSAFSFFNYIFIHKSFVEKEDLQVLEHELVHSKQLHTLDLIFFEILKIVLWFNPMIYIYQKRITLLHEYISDAEVVKETDKKQYFNSLLAETFSVENISFVNQFYKHSLIKKRIIMITKNKSQKMKQLKYLVLIPVFFSMLFYVSCTDEEQQFSQEVQEIIQDETITDGKYIKRENGEIHFFGKSLEGQVVSYDSYTGDEKEMYDKFMKLNNEKYKGQKMPFDFQIVIDENGDRVRFLKIGEMEAQMKSSEVDKNRNSKVSENENREDVAFAVIDKVPTFPGCEGTNEELKNCLNESIREFVAKNFNSDITKKIGLFGEQKIYIQFKILKDGNIETLGARAPHKDLEEEARRVVNLLPKMKAGEHRGEQVNVTYMLPITFYTAK